MATRTRATVRVAVPAMTGLVLTLGGLIFSPNAYAATAYVATGAVNVRSGPGTLYKVVGALASGEAVSGAVASGGWVRISYHGAAGYVSAGLLTTSAADAPSTGVEMVTTGDVNLRSEPNLESAIVRVLVKGTRVTTTGATSERFVEVVVDGAKNRVSGRYLAPAATNPTPPPPTGAYRAQATIALVLRKAAAVDAASIGKLTAGTTVSLTGTHSGSYSQIVRESEIAWALTGYLATTGDAPTLPKATGNRYVTADEVSIRATSAADGTVVGSAKKGVLLSITGKTAKNRTQVIFDGAARWVYTPYLAKSRPDQDSLGSESLDRTHAHVKAIVRLIRVEFPRSRRCTAGGPPAATPPTIPTGWPSTS